MPLPESNSRRELIHKRKVSCYGYRRDDGLWDIEGHLTDTKTYDFSNMDRGPVPAGEPVHEMWLRITVDDDLMIHTTEASTDYAPFNICPGAVANFSKIKDIKIGPGFQKEVARLVGGIAGLYSLAGTARTHGHHRDPDHRADQIKERQRQCRKNQQPGWDLPRLCTGQRGGATPLARVSARLLARLPDFLARLLSRFTGPAFLPRRQAG